jgi:hypothetical protein
MSSVEGTAMTGMSDTRRFAVAERVRPPQVSTTQRDPRYKWIALSSTTIGVLMEWTLYTIKWTGLQPLKRVKRSLRHPINQVSWTPMEEYAS